jgi:TolB-like protein
VVSRKRLKDLLAEQNLSMSGNINEQSVVEIGKLIGVQGFFDGYRSVKNNQVILSLNLIDSKQGVILWVKVIEKPLN